MLDFDKIEKNARERHIPIILDEGRDELIKLVRECRPKRVLEIGTAIGYSGSLILSNAPSDCILDTIELLEDRRAEAIENFTCCGVENRVNSYLGDAMELLEKVVCGNTYDLVFIDGPKSKYKQYLDIIKPHIRLGGYVFCDNVLFRGMVRRESKPPHKFRTIVVGLRKFLDYIENSLDYDVQILEKGDGIAIIKVIK